MYAKKVVSWCILNSLQPIMYVIYVIRHWQYGKRKKVIQKNYRQFHRYWRSLPAVVLTVVAAAVGDDDKVDDFQLRWNFPELKSEYLHLLLLLRLHRKGSYCYCHQLQWQSTPLMVCAASMWRWRLPLIDCPVRRLRRSGRRHHQAGWRLTRLDRPTDAERDEIVY